MNLKVFILVIVILVLAGGAWFFLRARKPTPITVPVGAKSGDLLDLQACEYKTKTSTYQAECGTLVVPENRQKPEARLIALPVKRIKSASSAPAEPIFYLAGGPGQSNMGFNPRDALLTGHDVVLVGYRGVDGSSVLNCPEIGSAILGDGQDVTSPASLTMVAEAMRACAARLEAEGVDLAGYSISEVVADMEAARQALGYPKINLLSESYGTRVAQIYAYLHPQVVSRSAMIGVNPPGHFIWEAATIERQVEQYSQLCARDADCRQHISSLADSMRKVAQNMPKGWLFINIDPGKVKIISHVLLYHRSTAPMAFDTWLAAERGDPSGFALMSLAYDLLMPKIFIWGDLLTKGGNIDYDPDRDYNELRAPDFILGSPMSLLIWQPASQGWPIYPVADEFRRVHPSDVETLLINGSVDFSTPLELGRDELLPALKNGKLVTLAEMGHVNDFWSVNPSAADRLLTSFYASGQADDSGFTYLPVDFKVSLGFPLLAKILLGTGLLFIIVPGLGLAKLIRKKAHRRNLS
ncbi:MAG: alpha/beta hydrolase [Anaerolineae bacterium]|nr:alpha/beta hydrolase [Anaerolineae bacterium]